MQNSSVNNCDVKLVTTESSKNDKSATAAAGSESEEWSSDWTWETCSSSDEEGVDFVKREDGSYAAYSLPRYVK